MNSPLLKRKTADGTYEDYELAQATTTVGRSSGADIRVDDPSISRIHFRIENRHGRFFIIDNKSSNGTFVNRRQITESPLKDGDEIITGRLTFSFRHKQPEEPAKRTQPMETMGAPETATVAMSFEEMPPPPALDEPALEPTTPPMNSLDPNSEMPPTEPDPRTFSPHPAEPDSRTYPPTPPSRETAPAPPLPPVAEPNQAQPADAESDQTWPADQAVMPPTPTPPADAEKPAFQVPQAPPPVEESPYEKPAVDAPAAAPLRRLGAYLLDTGVVIVVSLPAIIFTVLNKPGIALVFNLIAGLFGLLHVVVGWLKYGRTIGKYLLGLRVVEIGFEDRPGLSPKALVLRIAGYVVSAIPCMLLFLSVPFDKPLGRGIHDKLANTRVISEEV